MQIGAEPPRRTSLRQAAVLGIVVTALYGALSCIRLSAQGIYTDEVAQASAAFAYVGKPAMAAVQTVRGIPLMNLPYVGAIKTGIYGLYLRYVDPRFEIVGWRLLGIGCAALGVLLFYLVAGQCLAPAGLLLFGILLLTDKTLVLTTRHDWGPVALALLLRLVFLALWIRAAAGGQLRAPQAFMLGALAGLAVFEKLSSVVLIFPLVLFLALDPGGRRVRLWLACAAGGLCGGAPLLVANLVSYRRSGELISLADVSGAKTALVWFLPLFATHYPTLGNSLSLEMWLLGVEGADRLLLGLVLMFLEGCCLIGLLLLTLLAWSRCKAVLALRMAAILVLAYFGIGLLLFLLPRTTWVHHWILGTPFQYAALALALPVIVGAGFSSVPEGRRMRTLFAAVLALFLAARLLSVASLADSLARGKSSINWDPSLTRFAAFAAGKSGEAVFLAADWGLTHQIHCLSNGHPDLVLEPFHDYRGLESMQEILGRAGKRQVYLVMKLPRARMAPESTERILVDMGRVPGCREVPLDEALRGLAAVEARKFDCAGG
jgi:hypothetical protein